MLARLECARCARTYDENELHNRCACGGTLAAIYEPRAVSLAGLRSRPPGMWRYRELLPLKGDPISLGEPQTPLLRLERLSTRWGVETWLKDESPLPGTTFKARGAAVGLSRAIELGAERLVMPSAGNAGGAWALYAARAGIPLTVTMSRHAPESNQREV
ncbi:MAG: pyridoxal-phosphate dependent enzyme, partial [Actinobacteria bacterium]|nr:pyridoxal-phosphate dependent enzyme [Actinomycetota bacterium]